MEYPTAGPGRQLGAPVHGRGRHPRPLRLGTTQRRRARPQSLWTASLLVNARDQRAGAVREHPDYPACWCTTRRRRRPPESGTLPQARNPLGLSLEPSVAEVGRSAMSTVQFMVAGQRDGVSPWDLNPHGVRGGTRTLPTRVMLNV